MKARKTSIDLAVKSASNVHRKHPVSIAVSVALLAAAAASVMAAEGTAAPAENAGAQGPAQPDAPATGASDAGKPKTGTVTDQGPKPQLETIVITGVRESQEKAIEVKRLAPSIQDSISAENIGQLPDVTITDALQRITGVQINRDGGVGTSVDVRGLPQVGTMLNGEVFITPDQIDSQQPDFTTLPATLFNQVDVIKSPTSAQTTTGISGAIDLHTYRPWDLPTGFTYAYSLNGEKGDVTRKTGKEGHGLISYNGDGRWGLQLSADYADTTLSGARDTDGNGNPGPASEGLDQYGVVLNGENAGSAGGYGGFLAAWNGAPIPAQIHQFPNGSVDVNGDGKSNGVFMGSQNISLYDLTTQRKRKSANASFQFDFGSGLTFTSDYFYAHQDEWDRNIGIQFNSTNWQGATYVPLKSRNTGATTLGAYNTPPPDQYFAGSQIYATSVYEKWPGDVESYSQVIRWDSTAQNFNAQVDFNNGGPFKGSVRGIYEKAHQSNIETDINISDSDGCLWADARTGLPCGTFV